MTEHIDDDQRGGHDQGDDARRKRVLATVGLGGAAVLIAAGVMTGVVLMNANTDNVAQVEPSDGESAPSGASGDHDASGGTQANGAGEAGSSGSEVASGSSIANGVASDRSQILDQAMGGQAAIDALGDNIEIVADRNSMSVEELKETLLQNPSAKVSRTGFLYFP